jgi:hypothetical protein
VRFLFTVALELPVYALALRKTSGDAGLPHRVTLGLNLLTHPLLYVVVLALGASTVVPSEVLVMVVEGGVLRAWFPRVGSPWAWAVAANLLSWQGGPVLLRWLISVQGGGAP